MLIVSARASQLKVSFLIHLLHQRWSDFSVKQSMHYRFLLLQFEAIANQVEEALPDALIGNLRYLG